MNQKLSTILSITLLMACSKDASAGWNFGFKSKAERGHDPFPTSPLVDAWFDSLKDLDLSSQNTSYSLASGGTSIYAKVSVNGGSPIGAFLPENSATNPNTEVAAFNLGRILGYPDLFQAAVVMTLDSTGVQKFQNLLSSTNFSSLTASRQKNYNRISAMIAANPYSLMGAFKGWYQGKPLDFEALEDSGRVSNGGLNASHRLARLIQASGPRPTNTRIALLGGSKYGSHTAEELLLAKQLSTILIVDAITGQWDRYSGGNISLLAFTDSQGTKRIQLYAADNGGANFNAPTKWTLNHLSWVSRYDRNVVSEVYKMYAFMSGQSSSFYGFNDTTEFCAAIGLRIPTRSDKNTQTMCTNFKRNLALVVSSIEANHKRFGNEIYF